MALIVQIVSAASPVGERYFVNLGGGQVQVNQNIILWGWSDIQWDDCWEMTPDGMIVCAVDPQLVIGVDGNNNVITVQRNESDSTQRWTIARLSNSAACTIQNQSTSQYLTVSGSSIEGGPPLITEALGVGGVPEGQNWIIAPMQTQVIPQQFYIRSKMTGNDTIGSGTPFVMAAAGSSAASKVVIDTWQPGAPSQLWAFNGDGTVSSGYGSSLVLTTLGTQDSDVSIDTLVADNPLQTWIVGDQGNDEYKDLIYVQTSGGTLNLNLRGGTLKSNQNVLAFYEQPYAANDFWELIPALPVPAGTWFSLQVDETAEGFPFVLTAAASGKGVTIDLFQPGAANQLWVMQADGTIVSALDRSMALTANSSSDNPVTMSTVQSPLTSEQQWYIQGYGLVVNYSANSGLQYLNVKEGGPASAGQAVITDSLQLAPNTTWSVVPYQPRPSGQWFSIQSATVAPSPGIPYLLTAWSDGQVLASPPQDSTIIPDGLPNANQLWRMTLQGVIVSAVNPNLVLTVNSDGNVVLAPSNGSTDQQWAWGTSASLPGATGKYGKDIRCGVLANLGGSGNVLYAGQANNFFLPITLQAEQGAGTDDNPRTYPGQFWCMVPFLPAFEQWTTIRSLAAGGLFLNLPAKPKTSDQAAVGRQNGSLSTWQFAWPGYIVSATSPEIVLSLSIDGSSVVALPRQPGLQPFQLWTATPDGALLNRKQGQALEVSGSAEAGWTVTVTTTALSGSPGQMQQWEFSPGAALQTVLAQPPVPYPEAATTGETTAYTYVNQSLGLSPDGLRTQYANLAAPLASYQSRLNGLLALPPPDGVSPTEWTGVVKQLNEELTAVIAVQTLFQQVTTLYLELSQAQAMALSEVVTAAALPNGMQTTVKPKKKGLRETIEDVIGGLVYTGLNMAGTEFGDPDAGGQLFSIGVPAIANLMQTGISSGQAGSAYRHSAPNDKYQAVLNNIYVYEMSVLEMQQALLSEFQAGGAALGEIETLILADWGKLQAVYRMIRTPGGISSLYWPSTMTPILAKRMLPGYITGVLQALMPANNSFSISATLHTNTGAAPWKTGLSSDFTQFIEDNDDATQNKYIISKASTEVLAMVFANGTDPADFFRGLNGWAIPLIYNVYYGKQGFLVSDFAADIVVTIQNFTGQKLDLTIQCTGLLGAGGHLISTEVSDQTVTIMPYGIRNFAGTTYAYGTGAPGWSYAAMGGTFNVTTTATTGQQVLAGTITNDNPVNNQATYKWSASATAPYRCVVTQDVVNPPDMYLVNIAIYDS